MKRAQKIAFVSPRFAAEGTVGGAETLLRRLAERAAADGREVVFLTTCARNHFTWDNELPAGRRMCGSLAVEYFPVDPHRDVEAFLQAQAAISRGQPVSPETEDLWIRNSVNSQPLCDFLEKHGVEFDALIMGPYLFGLVYHAALIHPEKTFLIPCLHDESFAYLALMRRLFNSVRGCLFNTPPEADLARRLYDYPETKCAVVGMGLDPFTTDPQDFLRRHNLHDPYVLYSGRREGGKGTPLLCDYVEAFRRRTGRPLKLVFTGSGPIEAPPELYPHILDLGFVSESEKHAAMAGAAVFCHPSINESLSIVLLESWLAGTPALVHARSPVLQWQCRQSGGGLWFRTYPEFEEELTLLLDQPGLRKSLGQAGKTYVQSAYAWPAVEQRLFTALDA
jgi:glycosyltransferase involved in cell wall biosynthesis